MSSQKKGSNDHHFRSPEVLFETRHSLQTLTNVMASQPTPGPRTPPKELRPYDQGL